MTRIFNYVCRGCNHTGDNLELTCFNCGKHSVTLRLSTDKSADIGCPDCGLDLMPTCPNCKKTMITKPMIQVIDDSTNWLLWIIVAVALLIVWRLL